MSIKEIRSFYPLIVHIKTGNLSKTDCPSLTSKQPMSSRRLYSTRIFLKRSSTLMYMELQSLQFQVGYLYHPNERHIMHDL